MQRWQASAQRSHGGASQEKYTCELILKSLIRKEDFSLLAHNLKRIKTRGKDSKRVPFPLVAF